MKRFFVMLCLAFLLCSFVDAGPIYKYEDTTPITDTVSLTNVREFFPDYNISYSYIKMNLEDERVKLKLLTSDEGSDVLTSMSGLVRTDENTVASINGDFFSIFSGNKGFSLGIEKKDGKIIQSPINPDTMATVAYDGRNVLMTYLDFNVRVVSSSGEKLSVRHINKHTSYFGDLLMYTSDFNDGFSPAPGGDVVEVVVSDGRIVEFRRGMEPCEIPEDGCVLVVSEGSSMFFANNFSVGEKIDFEWEITPDLDEFDTAFGAGAMLVHEGKDVGKIGDYTHTVAGFNPRSALGVDKEGKTLYLVAVDGRQEQSRGMRMSHLAELLIDLGCYTAVNLDGGGSTRMVASTLWNPELLPVNNPTENRRIINAVGIVLVPDNEELTEENGEADAEEAEQNSAENEDEEFSETEETQESQEIKKTEENTDSEETRNTEETDSEEKNVREEADPEESKSEKQKTISGIKIKPEKQIAFVGETVGFTVVAHDEQLRGVEFDEEELEFYSSEGGMTDGKLQSDSGGNHTVSVTLGEHYAEANVYYIDEISGIYTDSVVYMNKGETKALAVYVFDYYGRCVRVESFEKLSATSSDEKVISVKDNVLTAENNGTAVVTLSKDGAVFYVSVAVGEYISDYLYDFENTVGAFTSYPDDTKGSFELSQEYFYSGKQSGKLEFDFTDNVIKADLSPEETLEENTQENAEDLTEDVTEETAEETVEEITEDNTEEKTEENTEDTTEAAQEPTEVISENSEEDDISRAVYFSLFRNVLIDDDNRKVTIKVYSPEEFCHEIRCQIVYGGGKVKNLEFEGEVISGEWSTLSLEVPEEYGDKIYLSRVYVLYTPGEEKDKGSIYIDDISLVTSNDYVPEVTGKNVYRYTENNSNVKAKMQISVVSEVDNSNSVSMFEMSRVNRMTLNVNGIVVADKAEKTVFEDDYAVYVTLDTSKGGIRNTDSSQWELLCEAQESSERKNLFIITNDDIFGNDKFENEVIIDYLASLDKNVFVVSRGNATTYLNVKGVKYFTVDSTPRKDYSLISLPRKNAIEFSFGDAVTFSFNSI